MPPRGPGKDVEDGEKKRVGGTLVSAILLLCFFVLASLLFVFLPSSDGSDAGNLAKADFWSRRPAAAAAIRAGQHMADKKSQASKHPLAQWFAGRGPDGRHGKIAIRAAHDPSNKAKKIRAGPPQGLWNSSHGKYSAKYKKIGIKGRHVASASKSGGETLRSSAFMAKGLLTKGVKLLKSTVFVGAPNKKRSEQGFQVVGGIPAMSRAGQEQRLKTGQPAPGLSAVKGPGSNECKDSCPQFLTYAISIKDADGNPMRGTEMQQFVKFPFDSSADMLMGAIHMAATGLASSHACFKLTVYTDHDKVAQSGVADIGLGDRVVIKKMPESMPENPYDNFQEPASLGTDRGRWSSRKMSALRWRLDLINKELSEGVDKVIWMDLSTLIASDMSCLYQKLSHFIYRPDDSTDVTRLAVDAAGRLFGNITKSRHLVYDDLFMADKTLVQDMKEAERELSEKNAVGTKGLISYLGMVSQKAVEGKRKLNDLMKETDKCWGFQYRNRNGVWIGEHPSENGGKALMCTLSCKPVGAMSFNWQSFHILRWHPCTVFRGHDAGPFNWFEDRFATAYTNLTKSCNKDHTKRMLRPCMSQGEASKMVSRLSNPGILMSGHITKTLESQLKIAKGFSEKRQALYRGFLQNTTKALQNFKFKLKSKNAKVKKQVVRTKAAIANEAEN